MRYIRAECRSCFDHADFSAENIACGLSTESMKRRAGDGRTIKIYINTARIEVPFMWGSLRLAPIITGWAGLRSRVERSHVTCSSCKVFDPSK